MWRNEQSASVKAHEYTASCIRLFGKGKAVECLHLLSHLFTLRVEYFICCFSSALALQWYICLCGWVMHCSCWCSVYQLPSIWFIIGCQKGWTGSKRFGLKPCVNRGGEFPPGCSKGSGQPVLYNQFWGIRLTHCKSSQACLLLFTLYRPGVVPHLHSADCLHKEELFSQTSSPHAVKEWEQCSSVCVCKRGLKARL